MEEGQVQTLKKSNKTTSRFSGYKIEATRYIMRVFADREIGNRGAGTLISRIEEVLTKKNYPKRYIYPDQHGNKDRILPYEPVKHFLGNKSVTPTDPDVIQTFIDFIENEETLENYINLLEPDSSAMMLGDAWLKTISGNKYDRGFFKKTRNSDLVESIGIFSHSKPHEEIHLTLTPNRELIIAAIRYVPATPYVKILLIGYEDPGLFKELEFSNNMRDHWYDDFMSNIDRAVEIIKKDISILESEYAFIKLAGFFVPDIVTPSKYLGFFASPSGESILANLNPWSVITLNFIPQDRESQNVKIHDSSAGIGGLNRIILSSDNDHYGDNSLSLTSHNIPAINQYFDGLSWSM